jgi:hypothetical protein
VVNFLSAKGVSPKLVKLDAGPELTPPEVAEIAKKFTVQIFCQGVFPMAAALVKDLVVAPGPLGHVYQGKHPLPVGPARPHRWVSPLQPVDEGLVSWPR